MQIQRGVAVIPKSVTPSRIEENLKLFDFAISDEDVATSDGFGRRDGRLIIPEWSQMLLELRRLFHVLRQLRPSLAGPRVYPKQSTSPATVQDCQQSRSPDTVQDRFYLIFRQFGIDFS